MSIMTIKYYSVCVTLLYLLLSSQCHVSQAGRAIPSSAPSTVVRPLAAEDYANLRPRLDQKGEPVAVEFKDCLPKGFRHASAPSRFVNFHTLGSTACNSSPVRPKKP